jgi:integrase/recombinase XerC/integrase/recombinase XerD
MYDTGLRVGELVQVDAEMLRDGNSKLYLPAGIQKDYPNSNTPDPVTLSLSSDTTRTLSAYLTSRWKETDALFPSRSADRMTPQAVRNMLHKVAETAEVRPYRIDGTRGEP